MRVLFDQGVPAPLRHALSGHQVETAYERGWSDLKNGELLAAAESGAFEVFITTDRSLRYQQNLDGRGLAIVVLLTTSWPRIRAAAGSVREAIDASKRGSYAELSIE